jgi:hypothetical protein
MDYESIIIRIDDIEQELNRNMKQVRNNVILCIIIIFIILMQLSYLSYNIYYMEKIVNTTISCDCKGYLDDMVDNVINTSEYVYNNNISSILYSYLQYSNLEDF